MSRSTHSNTSSSSRGSIPSSIRSSTRSLRLSLSRNISRSILGNRRKPTDTVLSLKDKDAAKKWNKRIERYMRKTQNSYENLRQEVMQPKDIEHNEWIAGNLIEFVNDISYIYG